MADDDTELATEFLDTGWDEIDLLDAFDVIGDALDYMDEGGYI